MAQPAAAQPAAAQPAIEALFIPSTPWQAPHPVRLDGRVDYLDVISERLGGHAPLGMHARHSGQATTSPVLYFLLVDAASAAHERNAFASRLAGFDVFGDALLADVKLDKDEYVIRLVSFSHLIPVFSPSFPTCSYLLPPLPTFSHLL